MEDCNNCKTYLKIAKAIEFIASHRDSQPSLANVAAHVHLSEFHLQRLFSEWVGLSPKQFLMYQTVEYAKSKLATDTVMNSALESGLSGAGRLHDLMVTVEGITPGEYKKRCLDLRIYFGIHESMFGLCLIATTERGICKISFFNSVSEYESLVEELKLEWPGAVFLEDAQATAPIADKMFLRKDVGGLRLFLKGTNFQLNVWRALLAIPESGLRSYQQLADQMGCSSSVRAVASAIGRNKLAYLIPCHRVIRGTGEFNQYRWGRERKVAMIVSEAALS